MHRNYLQKFFVVLKRILYKIRPRFSFHYIAYTSLFILVIFSALRLVLAVTPNPGHPWNQVGDGIIIFTNGEEDEPIPATYTYTLPAANARIVTTDDVGGAVKWNDIASPSANQSLSFDDAELTAWDILSNTETFHTYTANSLTTGKILSLLSSSLTSGTLLDLSSTGTGALTGQKGLNISLSGANGTGAQTTYGSYISNTHTGTSTNVGLYVTASGGSNNYSAIFNGGNVGIGTTTPLGKLDVRGGKSFFGVTADPYSGNSFPITVGGGADGIAINTTAPTNSTTGLAIGVAVTGDAYLRTLFYSNGNMGFGPGNATRDVYFGRHSSNTLGIFGSYDGTSTGNLYVSGSVGIGTASPTAVLHLKAGTATASTAPLKFTSGALLTTAEAGAIEFLTNNYYGTDSSAVRRNFIQNNLGFTGGTTLIGGTATTDDLSFKTTSGVGATGADMHFLVGNNGATEAMTILNNGNVGIGTTIPGQKLTVNGGTDGYIASFMNNSDTNGVSIGVAVSGSEAGLLNGNNDKIIAAYDIGISDLYYFGNSALAINNGNVGIGTITPTNILSIGGTTAQTMWMERNTTASTAGQGLTLHSGGAYSGGTNLSGGNLTLSSGISTGTGSSDIYFNTATPGTTGTADNAPTTKLAILGNGNVGIGTTSPTSLLHVNGTSYFSGNALFSGNVSIDTDPTNNSSGFEYGNGYDPTITNYDNEKFRVNSFFESPFVSMGIAQNFLLQTEVFDNASWVKTNIGTVSANGVVSPNGVASAEQIPAGTVSTANINQTITNSTTGYWTAGVWARAQSGTSTISLRIDSSAETGTEKTINLTTKWQFFSITQNFTSAHTTKTFRIISGTNAISLWGARMSTGQTPQTYSARTTSALPTATPGAFFNGTTIYGTLSGNASSASSAGYSTYSNYGVLFGNTLTDVSNKTNQWEYFGNMYLAFNTTYRYGQSWNIEVILKEQSNNNTIVPQSELEKATITLKGSMPTVADGTAFNSAVPDFSIEISGNTKLTKDDIAARVHSTDISTKYIYFYVKLKNPNSHYLIEAQNRYGSSYRSTGVASTSYCYFNALASQAVVASLPAPAQGSIVYATQVSGSNIWKFLNNDIYNLNTGNVGIGTTTPTSKLDVTTNSLGVTQTNSSGLALVNSTAAADGAQQISPALVWQGQGWKTDATASSQPVRFRADILPVQGSANASANWQLASSINGGSYTNNMTVTSNSIVKFDANSISIGNVNTGNANDSNFLGASAGYGATSATGSNFMGNSAGYNATNASVSNFLGSFAGYGATDSIGSNFLGSYSGYNATTAPNSNFFGPYAGYGATTASKSNFLGYYSGFNATGATDSNFLGFYSGDGATSASNSNFLGSYAGDGATGASNSNFLGSYAGSGATGSSNSNFFGPYAGSGATGASYSNIFGYNTGMTFTGNNLGSNNIIIGTNISLPNATANAINLGGVLFATGTYATTTGDPSIAPTSNGNVGIGIVSPTARLQLPAGTATANTAPLKFTSGALLTTAEAGAIEFLTNNYYGTDSSAVRRNFIQNNLGFTGGTTLVGGTATTDDLSFKTTSGVGATGADMHFLVGNNGATEAMTILNNGYVGIGTTAPIGKLDVVGGISSFPSTSGTTQAASLSLRLHDSTNAILDFGMNAGSGAWLQSTDKTNLATNYSLLLNPNGGNVGIGTTAPTSILAFGGKAARTIQMERNTTAGTAGQGLTLSSGGAIAGTADLAGGDLTLKSGISTGTGSSALRFFTATASTTGTTDNTPTEKMTILGSGNVGIGNNNPSSLLYLYHAAQITTDKNILTIDTGSISPQKEMRIAFTVQGASYPLGYIGSAFGSDTTSSYTTFGTRVSNTVAERMRIDTAGNIGIGTTAPSVSLDVIGPIISRYKAGPTWPTDANGYVATYVLDNGGTKVGRILPYNGSTYLDLAIGNWNSGNPNIMLSSIGNVGIGVGVPTAKLHLAAGTASAGTAPLKFTSGTHLTTAEAGAMEFNGTDLFFTPSTTRETIAFMSDITTAAHNPVTLGAIGSSPNANGMTLTTQVLNLEPASASYGGVVTTGTQTFAGAKTFTGPTTIPKILIQRVSNVASGISWYNGSTYTSWSEYMGQAGTANLGPTGNITAPTGSLVTGWGLRSFIENTSGYGWTWEGGTSASATPSIVAELSSNTGNFKTSGSINGTSILSPTYDTATAVAMNIGTATQTGLTLGRVGATTAIAGSTITAGASTTTAISLGNVTSNPTLTLLGTGLTTLGGNLTVSGTGNSSIAGNLGIGTTSPAGRLNVARAAGDNLIYADVYSTTAGNSNYWFSRRSHNGTLGALTTTESGDSLGVFYFQGVNNVNAFAYGAEIMTTQNGAAGTYVPTDLKLQTYSATAHNSNQLVLSNTGNIGIYDSTPDGTLDIDSAVTTGVNFGITNTGVYTGTGLLSVVANSATTGTLGLMTANGLSSGSILSLTSAGTAGLTNQKGLNIALSGTNATSAQTTYGAYISNTHAGTTSTNVGLYATATGGTTANYAAIFENGNVGVGTTAPGALLHILKDGAAAFRIERGSANISSMEFKNTAGSMYAGINNSADFAIKDAADIETSNYFIVKKTTGNVGIGDTTPSALFTVGNGDLFQVSSAGAVTAVGVNSGTGLIQGTGGLTITGNTTLSGSNMVGASPLSFDGATADAVKTIFAITNPTTSSKTITFPDASITVNAAAHISGTTLASGVVTSSLTTVGALASGSIATGFGNISTAGNISTTTSGTITSAGLLTASNGLTLTTGALNLTATSGALTLSGLSASSISTGANALTITSSNLNTTATGINSTAIGATTASTGAFTTLTSSGNSTIGTGASLTNTFGSGASSINTIGSATTPGTLTLLGSTIVAGSATTTAFTLGNVTTNPTLTLLGTGLTTLGGNLTVTGTTWTATPTISGLITATSGLTSNGTLTVGANQNFVMTSGTGTSTQTFTGTTTTASTIIANSLTTGTGQSITSTGLTSGSLLSLTSAGTAGLTNQKGLNIALSGTNSNSAQTTYGAYISNTHAGTTSTNVGLYATASGGTTANYAAIFAGGNVGIGTTTPANKITAVDTLTDTSGYPGSYKFNQTINPSGTSTALSINAYFSSISGGSADISSHQMYGQYNDVTHNRTDTLGVAIGLNNRVMNNSSGTIGSAYGLVNTIMNINAGGVISNAGAVKITSPNNAGTLTNTWGLYIDSQTAGTQTNTPYAIYQAGSTDLNYFAGKVGIGTTAPGELLSLGTAGTTKGVLSFAGDTSGKIIIQPASAAGTYTLTLPATDGNASEFLQTDGSGNLTWATASTGGVAWDAIGDPSGNGAIAMGATVQTMDWATATTTNALSLTGAALTTGKLLSLTSNSLTSGTLLDITSAGTAGLTNQKGLNIALSGTNATSAQTTYGAYISNTHAGTTSTNVGLYATATGGTTANYAAIFQNGNVGIGTTTPSAPLSVGATSQFQVSSAGAVTAVGVNSGAGLIQGTGGLTVTGNVTLSSANIVGASPLSFDGTTADAVKTIFAITNPTTSSKTITFPDRSITVNAAADISGTTLASGVVTSSLTTVGALASGSIATGFGNISTAGNISTTTSGTITSAGLLTGSNGLTLTTGALNLTGTSGALTLSGLSASSISTGANALTVTSSNFNTTATGINSTAIGATTASTGAFTSLTSNSTTTIGNGSGIVTTIGNTGGAAAVNINVGTGNFSVNGVAASTYTIGNAAQTGTITIGASSAAGILNLATGAGASTVNIGTGVTNAKAINIGTGAVANTIAIGSASATGVSITDNNWSVTAAGAATFSSISGAISGSSGSFTTLTSSGNSTIGTGSSLTNTFGSGASSINTIGSATTPGTLTLLGSTIVAGSANTTAFTLGNVTSNPTLTLLGTGLTTLGGNLTVSGTSWTATPTISGLITATSGLTSNGILTVGANQNFVMTSGTGTSTQTFTGTTTTANTITANSLTTGTGQLITSTGLTSGSLLSLTSAGTAGLTNQKGLNIALSGTNATSAQTTYGAYISNTHAGTTSTNVGLYATATGGTTANYAAIFDGGNVGIGISAPESILHVVGDKILLQGSGNGLYLDDAITVGNTSGLFSSGGDEQIATYNAVTDTYWYANSNIVSVAGNVGIGTTAPSELLSLGLAGTTKGVLSLAGNTSGKIIIQPAADAGTYTLTLPTTDGDASQFLQTDGSGNLTWATGGSGGVAWDAIGDPSGNGSIAMGATVQTMDWATATTTNALSLTGAALTTGKLLSLNSDSLTGGTLLEITSVGAGGGLGAEPQGQKGLRIGLAGTNTTSGETTYGAYISNTHTGTTSTNVGLYATATGGTNNYAAIFNGGNVGLGTSTPGAKLQIKGAGTTTGINFQTLNSSGTPLITALDNGNLGIGVTNPVSYALDISTNMNGLRVLNTDSTSLTTLVAENDSNYQGILYKVGSAFAGYSTLNANDLGFYNDSNGGNISILNDYASGNINFAAGGSSVAQVVISPTGLVGIGTSSPTYDLGFGGTVKRDFGIERNTTANTLGKAFSIMGGGATVGATDKDGGNLKLYSGVSTGTGASDIQFFTSPAGTTGTADNTLTERMRILGSGYVGIGTTAPRGLLDITSGTSNTVGDVIGQSIITGPTSATMTGNLFIQSNDAQAADKGGTLAFGARAIDANTNGYYYASIKGAKENSTTGSAAGYLRFNTRTVGNVDAEVMRITSTGFVGVGTTAPASKFDITTNSLGVTQTNDSGLLLINNTPASSGAQQVSPAIRFRSQGWKTNATAASQPVDWRIQSLPVQGATNPTSNLMFSYSINDSSYNNRFSFGTNGILSGVTNLSLTGTISGGTTIANSSTHTLTRTGLANTSTDGFISTNTTAALVGAQVQRSPRSRWSGTVWDTGASASRTTNFIVENIPTGGANPGNSRLAFSHDYNGGGYSELFTIGNNGYVGIKASSPASILEIGSSDLGDGTAGPVITLGRNTNATNTGAGSINYLSKGGTAGFVWQDAAGNMRINTSAPSNANDTAGTVIGAQTSTRDTKQDIFDFNDYSGALAMIANAPLHTFKYIKEVNGYGEDSPLAKTRIGFIADEVDPAFMVGNVIDQVSLNGLLMASVKEIDSKLKNLEINDQNIFDETSFVETQTSLRLANENSLNWVAFEAPVELSQNVTWTLPGEDQDGCFKSDGQGNMTIGSCGDSLANVDTFHATGAELAEIYETTDETLEAGDVVAIDIESQTEVKKTTKAYDGNTIGVVSTDPGLIVGDIGNQNGETAIVALSGQVPVKVNLENGPINKGDNLTPSNTPGVAMKATKAGIIIGQAMTEYIEESGEAIVVASIKTGTSNGSKISQVIPGLELLATPEGDETLDVIEGEIDTNENGEAIIEEENNTEIITPTTEAQKIALTYFLDNKIELEEATDISEIYTDRLSAALEIITPTVITDTLSTNQIVVSTGEIISFNSPTEFVVPPLFNSDTAGFAIIKEGDTKVTITYDKPYIGEPVVNANIAFNVTDGISNIFANDIFMEDLKSMVVDSDQNGFTIVINKNAPRDLRFSWTAFRVKDPKVFESVYDGLVFEDPEEENNGNVSVEEEDVINQGETIVPDITPDGTVEDIVNNDIIEVQTEEEVSTEVIPADDGPVVEEVVPSSGDAVEATSPVGDSGSNDGGGEVTI